MFAKKKNGWRSKYPICAVFYRMQKTFLQKILEYTKPGMTVLDVGAGVLKTANKLTHSGYNVTALDKHIITAKEQDKIRLIEADFTTWTPDQYYDIVLLENSAQFMDKNVLINKLIQMSPEIIAIRTYYGPPEPDFEVTYSMTYYTPNDLIFPGYSTKIAHQYKRKGVDIKGVSRVFCTTDYIGIKESVV